MNRKAAASGLLRSSRKGGLAMGRLCEYNSAADNGQAGKYSIRIPLRMTQLTERDGRAWPLAFEWKDAGGEAVRVKVDRVVSVAPCAEQKSGSVGDRYECDIGGRLEYLYYSKLQPRKWFKVQEVSEAEYNAYYKLPGEPGKKPRANVSR
ncbi:MAG: hypothetical protein FWG53_03665 [Clostridiales bacterium]|nr:hypothetical protein [Clostridiales bacterium]